jgi:hypothetical protein
MAREPRGGRHPDDRIGASGQLSSRRPSNEKLLCTAFVSFQCFAIAQTVAALFAGSEAMLGDSAAMMVDALTYLFNWFAERQKLFYASKLDQPGHSTSYILEYRKYTYQLELVPPLLSVSTLLIVTGFVLNKSIRILILDSKRDASQQADPNVTLMIIFSVLNLLLDGVNVGCFALAKHALGYKTREEGVEKCADVDSRSTVPRCQDDEDADYDMEERRSLSFDGSIEKGTIPNDAGDDDDDQDFSGTGAILVKPFEMDGPNRGLLGIHSHRGKDDGSNLNMCSAFTVGIESSPLFEHRSKG